MAGLPRAIEPSRLVARRTAAGLSRAELAARTGISPRMIYFYEQGRHTTTPSRLERLASALGCEAEALAGVPQGQETLSDLRHATGLTLEGIVKLLRASAVGRELCVSESQIAALESGLPVEGQHWQDPEVTGRLLATLAKAYAVPMRMVLDAWMRTRPRDPVPVLHSAPMPAVSQAPLEVWESLNERQQIYLEEIMRDDRMTETEMWMRRVQRLPGPPATQWRKLPLALRAAPSVVGYTRLQERLRRRGLHDPGTGQTVHALERRGLLVIVEDSVEHPGAGEVQRVLVQLTRRGRAAARAGLGEPRPQAPGTHLLSEWLWGVLARVAAAEPVGLESDALAGRALFFIGVGYRNKRGGRPSRGLVDAMPVQAPGGTHVAEYRWRLTPLGRRHLAEYLDIYRELYPRVDTAGLSSSSSESS
ncbi:helix-turn-helix transcriptional regulator [Kribbella sp. NPDC023972]|uniref:helix-turn-helix domain-containing protein n=1 Tax=Kribbella sp. NPDC023972 TaxID=3154795 RepID=UPI0033E84D31